jgi:hypothetical protein
MFDMDTVLDDDDVFENRRSSADSALNNTEPRKDIVAIAENTLYGISRLDDDKNFQMFETRFLLEGSATGRRGRRRGWKRIVRKTVAIFKKIPPPPPPAPPPPPTTTYYQQPITDTHTRSVAGQVASKKLVKRRSELADLVNSITLTKSVIMVGFEEDPRRRVGKFSACLQVCAYNTVTYAHKNNRNES